MFVSLDLLDQVVGHALLSSSPRQTMVTRRALVARTSRPARRVCSADEVDVLACDGAASARRAVVDARAGQALRPGTSSRR